MTTEQKLIKTKVGVFELAKQLGNVSKACQCQCNETKTDRTEDCVIGVGSRGKAGTLAGGQRFQRRFATLLASTEHRPSSGSWLSCIPQMRRCPSRREGVLVGGSRLR
jgi:hypothetical protein